MSAMIARSARLGAATRPVAARRSAASMVVRSTPEDKGPAVQPGTIFYGGQTFANDAEFQAAIDSGKLSRAASVAPNSSAAVAAAMPTLNEVMGFSGTAPEIVNGRLAMLGFVAAVAAEFSSGEGVLRQWAEEPTGIAMTFFLFITASLVPAFRRASDSLGPFTPAAELLNGRAAMIGFASLLAIEAVRGSPLF